MIKKKAENILTAPCVNNVQNGISKTVLDPKPSDLRNLFSIPSPENVLGLQEVVRPKDGSNSPAIQPKTATVNSTGLVIFF